MIKTTALSPTVIALVLSCLSFTSTDWFLYTTTSMSIRFPAKPKIEYRDVPTNTGSIKMTTVFYETTEPGDDVAVYGLITSSYPDSSIGMFNKTQLNTFFKSAIDGAVLQVKGKLLTEKVITINGFPGREMTVNINNGQATLKMKMLVVNNKTVMLQTITQPGKELTETATKFYNSFNLKLRAK